MKTTRKPLNKLSKLREQQRKEYRKRKKVFLESNDHCFVCGRWVCSLFRELHHVRGRSGKLYLDGRFWEMSCGSCHSKIHTDRKWAIANGFLGGLGEWGVCPL